MVKSQIQKKYFGKMIKVATVGMLLKRMTSVITRMFGRGLMSKLRQSRGAKDRRVRRIFLVH